MSEQKIKKLRFQLLELFPNAQGDVAVRVGTVSRKIKYSQSLIHPIYGLGWYALVEELFIHNRSDQLLNMSDFLKNLSNFKDKLDQAQQASVNSIIRWLEDLIGVCLNQHFIDEKSFISIYSTLFYTRVFKEYAEDKAQLNPTNQQPFYLEDALSLVSSFFIMKEFSQRSQNTQLNPELTTKLQRYLLQLMGDVNCPQNEQYLAGIDQNRVNALSFFYDLSLRLYQEISGEIQTFTKANFSSPYKMNLGLGFIFCNDDSYCIAYDQTLQASFCMFSHYKLKKQGMAENQLKLHVQIQEKKKQKYQLQEQEHAEFQKMLAQLMLQLNQNKADACVDQQKQTNLETQIISLEQEVDELLKSGEQLHQDLQKKQISKNNQEIATQSYYSKENNFMVQFKNDLAVKRQASINDQLFLEKQKRDYQEYLSKNKNAIEETNISNFQGKYAKIFASENIKCVIQNPQKKITCQNCCDDKIIREMIFMNCCGFQICAECMKQAFANNLKTLDSLKCLNEKCKKPFRDLVPFYQQGLLSDQDLKKLTEKFTYICPIDHTNFTLKESQSKTSKLGSYIVTPCCQTEICRHCWQIKHKKGEVCKSRVDSYLQNIRVIIQSINQKALELEKNPQKLSEKDLKAQKEELLKQKRFRFCPDCEILLIKDEHCERLECPQCKLEVCFNCVAPNLPIKDHDNCYHRDGCKYFAAEMPNDPRKMNPKCVFCQKKGSVCDLPASWKQYQQLVRTWYGDAFFAEEFAFNWINN